MVGQERTSLLPNHHLTDLKQEAALKSMETEISMKRAHDDDSDSSYGSDLLSRSPSPVYTHEAPKEKVVVPQSSLDTAISGGIGFKLLQQMGWSAGKGLGKQGQGRVDPIRAQESGVKLGLGKYSRDIKMLDSTTLNKKSMASLKMANETEADRIERESQVAQKQAVKDEISETLRAFFCDMCNKGPYANIGQFNNHLDSYDHAHVKRTKALQAANKKAKHASGEIEKRNERERKREEKEMLKLTGGKPMPSTSNQGMVASLPVPSTNDTKPVNKGCMKVAASNSGSWSRPLASGSSSTSNAQSHLFPRPPDSAFSVPPPPPDQAQAIPPPPSNHPEQYHPASRPFYSDNRSIGSSSTHSVEPTRRDNPSAQPKPLPSIAQKPISMGSKSIAKKPPLSMNDEEDFSIGSAVHSPQTKNVQPMTFGVKPTAKKQPISMDDEDEEGLQLMQKKAMPAKGGMKIGKIGFKPL